MSATSPTVATSVDAADSRWLDETLGRTGRRSPRPTTARTRRLLVLGLIGAALLVLWLRLLAGQASIDASFQVLPDGRLVLQSSSEPGLQLAIGRTLLKIVAADQTELPADLALLGRSPRWMVDDHERESQLAWRERLAKALQQPTMSLVFDGGLQAGLAPHPRGLAGISALCWLFCAVALALYLAAAVVLMGQPTASTRLYALMACAQACNLLLIGADALPGLGQTSAVSRHDLTLRLLADTIAATSVVHALTLYPTRLPKGPWIAAAAWVLSLTAAVTALSVPLPGLWWWAQGLMVANGLCAMVVLRLSMQRTRSPLTDLLMRLAMAGTGTLVLLSLAIVLASRTGLSEHGVAVAGSMVWQVFFASLLMLSPFLSRSRQVVREFATLAGISTVAASMSGAR